MARRVTTRRIVCALQALLLPIALWLAMTAAAQEAHRDAAYVGFDRNDYPGDAVMELLRKDFRFAGYWLNNPPGAQHNTWTGKRALLQQRGFGFLVLFNGRLDAALKHKDAVALGTQDGKAAAAAAVREGFARDTLIFLDQEEGGRLLPEQAAYIFAWVDAVEAAGARAGVYCSAIDVPEGKSSINTARDIVERDKARTQTSSKGKAVERVTLWIANDQCPPAPGCTVGNTPLSAALTPELASETSVWQYTQSPRRKEFTAHCSKNYAADGNCYAPGVAHNANTFLDLDLADSPDPSERR